MAHSRAANFMQSVAPPGREYPADQWGAPSDPYPDGESGWFGGVEEAMRSADNAADLNAPKNTSWKDSLLPLPSAFSANKGISDNYGQDPTEEAIEGHQVNPPVYAGTPPFEEAAARRQQQYSARQPPARPPTQAPQMAPPGAAAAKPAKNQRRGGGRSGGLSADQVRDIVAQTLAQHKVNVTPAPQPAVQHTATPSAPVIHPPTAVRHVEMGEEGSVQTLKFHVDFGEVSPKYLESISMDKPANKVVFEVPVQHFLNKMPANYNQEKGKYEPPNLERAVVESVTISHATNHMPLNLALGCDQLSSDHITGVHLSHGTTALYVMRKNETSQPAEMVYDARGKIKNKQKIAKYGGLSVQSMTDGVVFMDETLDSQGKKVEGMAGIPSQSKLAGVLRDNAVKNKEISEWIRRSEASGTNRINVPMRIFNSVTSTVSKTVEDQMKPTNLNTITVFITPSNGKKATDFSGTKIGMELAKMTEAEKDAFLSTPHAVSADVEIKVYAPHSVLGNDESKPYDKIDPAMRIN